MESGGSCGGDRRQQFMGVRQRRWGKWVTEIRVPGSKERLWLGSYSTPEAAAVAHDTAAYLLRGPSAALNFPGCVPARRRWVEGMVSPSSVQRAASNCGMAVDAQLRTRQAAAASGSLTPATDVALLVPPLPMETNAGQQGLGWTMEGQGQRRVESIPIDNAEICGQYQHSS